MVVCLVPLSYFNRFAVAEGVTNVPLARIALWGFKNIYCHVAQLGTLSCPTSIAKFGNLTVDVFGQATSVFLLSDSFPYKCLPRHCKRNA
jgi:hypothetical protein